MKTLITGGAGFIGSNLVKRQLEQGNTVYVLDNFSTSKKSNLPKHQNLTILEQDVCEPIKINDSIHVVYHLAGPSSHSDCIKDQTTAVKTVSLGTMNTLNFANEKSAKFVLASNSEVYGSVRNNVFSEKSIGVFQLDTPRSVFRELYRLAESITFSYRNIHKLKVYIARIFNVYGINMRYDNGNIVPTFITNASSNQPITIYGNGKQIRSYLYISDLVDALTLLVEHRFDTAINLGNTEEITNWDLAETIINMVRSRSFIRFVPKSSDDPLVRIADISLIEKVTGWKPHITLEQGLKLLQK